ncbi:hypothetical protein BGZ63DRAFT_397642 [Mariannaea sp. PMI_226]|nr:hypothetical protein BGZ63DRAFT_397642 [Mariannaea sp. PMI_226]
MIKQYCWSECPICDDSIDLFTACGHAFCDSCWVMCNQDVCPVCRQKDPNPVEEKMFRIELGIEVATYGVRHSA